MTPEQFETDFRAGRIGPERAENMVEELREDADAITERAAAIMAKGELSDKDRRRVERLEDEAAQALRLSNHVENFLKQPANPRMRNDWPPRGSSGATSGTIRNGVVGSKAQFSTLFGPQMSGTGADQGLWLQSALTGRIAQRFEHSTPHFLATATESVGDAGGFAVPTSLVAGLWDNAITTSSFLQRARVYPMQGPETSVAGLDWQSRTGGVVAGLLGVWLGEAQTATEDAALFRKINLRAHKVGIFCQLSNELLEDALNIETSIQSALRLSTAYTVDHALLRGSGVGQPLGVLNSPALVAVAKENSQVADTITARNLMKMLDRLDPASDANATWFANPNTRSELMRLSYAARDDAGTAVSDFALSGAPLFQMGTDGSARLMGRPLVFTEHCSALGDLGDIVLADWSRYAVGVRRAAFIERNNAPGWQRDAVDFRVTMRIAGTPEDSQPITPQYGDTFSPFVALAARA